MHRYARYQSGQVQSFGELEEYARAPLPAVSVTPRGTLGASEKAHDADSPQADHLTSDFPFT